MTSIEPPDIVIVPEPVVCNVVSATMLSVELPSVHAALFVMTP